MKKILVVLFVLVSMSGFAQKDTTDLRTLINANFPDNTGGFITPLKLRTVAFELMRSNANKLEDNSMTGQIVVSDSVKSETGFYVWNGSIWERVGDPADSAVWGRSGGFILPLDYSDKLTIDTARVGGNLYPNSGTVNIGRSSAPFDTVFANSLIGVAGINNTLDEAYDQGRTITIDAGAVELTGEGQDKLFEAKDTTDSFSNSFFQMYGNGSFRTGGGADMSMMGLGNGIDYPYATPAFASFIAGLNNDVTGVGATSVGNAVVGGADNIINESFVSSITGGYSNRINGGISCAIIASDQCVADSGVSIVVSSYQSGASGDHATVLNAYRGYARYYHQFMMGSQPIVDTTGFLFHTSSNWQLNNKTFTIGNGGVDEPTPIRMTNSITQIANGNMLIGTHWRDTYDDLDTNSAIFTVLGDSVGSNKIFDVLKANKDTIFSVTESGIKYADGTEGAGYVLTSDASGNASWQSPNQLQGFTVATLPAATTGATAYVTDASAPVSLSAVVGGGAVIAPVFYNGTVWIVM